MSRTYLITGAIMLVFFATAYCTQTAQGAS